MAFIEKMEKLYTTPLRRAIEVDQTCLGSIKARFLFIAQLIIAIAAIPFVLILGAIAARCSSDEDAMSNLWCESVRRLFIVIIPGSFLGIFLPLSTTFKCIHSFESCNCGCEEREPIYYRRSIDAERHFMEIDSNFELAGRNPYLVD